MTHHPQSSSVNLVTTFWTSLWKQSVDTVYVNAQCALKISKSIGCQTLSRGTFKNFRLHCDHPKCKAVVPLTSLRDHVTRCSPTLARQVLMIQTPSPQSTPGPSNQSTPSVTPSGGRPETPLTRSRSSPFSSHHLTEPQQKQLRREDCCTRASYQQGDR